MMTSFRIISCFYYLGKLDMQVKHKMMANDILFDTWKYIFQNLLGDYV